jgi:hypothetical protein
VPPDGVEEPLSLGDAGGVPEGEGDGLAEGEGGELDGEGEGVVIRRLPSPAEQPCARPRS